MKFTIEKTEIQKGLQNIIGIAENKGTISQLSNVLIETKDNKLMLSATDLTLSFKGEYNSTISESGSIAVNAKKLFEIVKELDKGIISFTTNSKNWLVIKNNKSSFKLPGLTADDFPAIPSFEDKKSIIINSIVFQNMIRKILISISLDTTRASLMGALLNVNIDKIKLVSTNGHRLSYSENKIIYSDNELNFIIPRKTLIEILKISVTKESIFTISFHDNYVIFKNNNDILISMIIDEQFPDYKEIIPKTSKFKLSVNKLTLLQSLKRMIILADDNTKLVKFRLSKNNLLIESKSSESGSSNENIQIQYDGADMAIGLNASYILDILSVLDGDIFFNLLSENEAILISCNDNFKYLIMPIKLIEENE